MNTTTLKLAVLLGTIGSLTVGCASQDFKQIGEYILKMILSRQWSRKPVPGDPDYVDISIEAFSPEFVEAMSNGWANFYDNEANIYRNRFNEKLKQAGPQEDPVKK